MAATTKQAKVAAMAIPMVRRSGATMPSSVAARRSRQYGKPTAM